MPKKSSTKKKSPIVCEGIMYHGTGKKEAREILKKGLRTGKTCSYIYLTTDRKVAKEYSKTQRKLDGSTYKEGKRRGEGEVLEIHLSTKDIDNTDAPEEVKEVRKKNLCKAYEEGWREYLIYNDIPPEKIKISKSKKKKM